MAKLKTNRSNRVSKTRNEAETKTTEKFQDAFEKAIISWYAPEFLRFHRSFIWYIIAGLLDAALIAYAIWSQSYTMVAVFVVLPLVYVLDQRHKPKTVEVKISQFGVRFGEISAPYSDIKSFWIIHEPPYVDELHLLVKNRLHPEVVIPLVGTDPTFLRQYLVTQVREWEGKKQSAMDVMTKFLKLN